VKPVQLHKDSSPTERLQWIEQTAGSLAELVLQHRDVHLKDLNAYNELLDKQKQQRSRRISRVKSIHFSYDMLLHGKDDRIQEIALELNPAFQKK
jgi:hypothetical protein